MGLIRTYKNNISKIFDDFLIFNISKENFNLYVSN